jgi:hydroxyacylglutathione hydrolase
MIVQQYYLSCLSHASYLIADETAGRAVVVDPQRDISAYLADAKRLGLRIERVIETHIHADFVSGHLELAEQTGATIWYGEPAQTEFPIGHLRNGERVSLGELELEVRATPGHTPESISLVVYEHPGDPVPHCVLTGDTLFIGDVGRPDLLAGGGMSPELMARELYRSLQRELLTLPDQTRVYPAHGAGSACGRSLSSETSSTIGEQRRNNYALAPMSEDEFVALVTEGQPVRPAYFSFDARLNRERHPLLSEDEPPPALTLEAVRNLQSAGAVVLDTRDPADFANGHLRGALNVGLQGRFAEYAGDIIRPEQSILLVCDPGTELEAKVRLGRIGFDAVAGFLSDPMQAFLDNPALVDTSSRLTATEVAARLAAVPDVVILDVRNRGELERGVIPGHTNIPLAALMDRLDELDPAAPTVVHCAGGYRSSIAASLLVAHGFCDVSDLLGGYEAWALKGRTEQVDDTTKLVFSS